MQKRVQSGVPAGGQFAPDTKGESDVTLLTDPASDPIAAEIDDSRVLAYYRNLDDENKKLFAVITDPENFDDGVARSRQDVIDEIEETYGAMEGSYELGQAEEVFHRLRRGYERQFVTSSQLAVGEPRFSFESDGEGVDGYSIAVYTGRHGDFTSISEYRDTGDITYDPESTGINAAMNYAQSLDGDLRRLSKKTQKTGMLPVSANDSVYAEELVIIRSEDTGVQIYMGTIGEIPDALPDGNYAATDGDGQPVSISLAGGFINAEREPDTQTAPSRAAARAEHVMNRWVDADEEPQTKLKDALTDLMHWADARGVDLDEALDRARWMHEDEKKNPH